MAYEVQTCIEGRDQSPVIVAPKVQKRKRDRFEFEDKSEDIKSDRKETYFKHNIMLNLLSGI